VKCTDSKAMSEATLKNRIRVWCLLRDQFTHVEPVERASGEEAVFVYDREWNPERIVRERPDIVLCVNDYQYDVVRCLEAARRQGIPSLAIQDGILEWRCQYENPLFGGGGGAPQHQPVMADKIACIGLQSARQIAAWGNPQKVEITGMPRLDYMLKIDAPRPCSPGKRILVMTAKKPGFTPEQCARTIRSLVDVKHYLDSQPGVGVVWRVSPAVVNEIGVVNQYREALSQELTDLLRQVDAVITTPSTAILEAMLLNRPVAALDYHNVPRFVPTAWTIGAPEHIETVIKEILNPHSRKLAFQRDCLHDCLRCDGPAAPRLAALILGMVRLAVEARERRAALSLPAQMVPCTIASASSTRAPLLRDLYPEQPIFGETSIEVLQLTVARLENENARLKLMLRSRNIPYLLMSKLRRWAAGKPWRVLK
jgi:hypothetical protein